MTRKTDDKAELTGLEAPTLGPTGSWLSVTIAMSTAVASKTDASTPTAPWR